MSLRGGPVRSSASAVSVPGWRIEDFHRLLTHFFQEGVVQGVGDELAVSQRAAGANMSVDVAAGLALIEVTTTLLSPNATLKTWLYSDDVVNVPVPAADLTNPRKDRIVAKFDMGVDPNTAGSNNVSIELVEGTPAGSPVLPDLPDNAIHLKTVNVATGATSIVDANLADTPDYVTLDPDVLEDIARQEDVDASLDAIYDGTPFYAVATGSSNAYAITLDPAPVAYAAGQRFHFKANFANTGAATLNVNGLGAKAIKKGGGATALESGDIDNGQLVTVLYDGTNFQMVSPPAASSSRFVDFLAYGTANSTSKSFSGATTEQLISDTGYTIAFPAGALEVGDVIIVELQGTFIYQENNSSTASVALKLGSTALATYSLAKGTTYGGSTPVNRSFRVRFAVIITTGGATGATRTTQEAVSVAPNANFTQDLSYTVGNASSIDFTGALTLQFGVAHSATATWNAVQLNHVTMYRMKPA